MGRMEWLNGEFVISDDPARLDTDWVIGALQGTYWAGRRPEAIIRRSIEKSICFGVYDGRMQVGFGRAVTDECTFAWICDVVIGADYRGRGLGTWLLECVLGHPAVAPTALQVLATQDAHGLYEKLGFVRSGDRMMTRRPNP